MVTTYHDEGLWPTHYCPPEGWHISMNVGAGVRNCPLVCRLMGHNRTMLFAHKLMSLEALMWQKYLQEFYPGEDLRDMWFVCKHLNGYYMKEEWACSLRLQRTGKKPVTGCGFGQRHKGKLTKGTLWALRSLWTPAEELAIPAWGHRGVLLDFSAFLSQKNMATQDFPDSVLKYKNGLE